MSHRIGINTGFIFLGAFSACIGAPSFPTPGTSTFLEEHPNVLALADGERLAALYGATIAEDDNPETTPLQFVEAFFSVEANRDALGIEGLELAYHKEFVGRDDRFRVYGFEQIMDSEDSLPVHGSLVKVLVRRGETDHITYIGAFVLPIPESALPEDVLDDEDAVAAVDQWPDYEGMVYSEPEKVIFHARNETIHRAWRFVGQDNGRSLLFLVDTADGRILDAVSVRRAVVDMDGVVKGWQTAGNAAFGEHEEVPLPGVRVRLLAEDVQYTCPSDEGTVLDVDYCDALGEYTISGATEGDRVTVRLVGEWATVWDCAGADAMTCILSGTPSASAVVECDEVPSGGSPEVDLTFGEAPACAGGSNPGAPCSPHAECPNGLCVGGWCLGGTNQGGACDPDANCTGGICETNPVQTAQVKAFLAVQQAHDWFKSLQPSVVEVDVSLPVFLDMTGPYSGAFFASFPNRIEIHRGSADIVDNPAIPSVVAHEYGHFLVNLATFQSFVGSVVDEDYADTVAAFVYDDPRIGCGLLEAPSGGWTSHDESCIRTIEADCPGTCRLTGVPCLQHADYTGSCYYGTGSNGPCDADPEQLCFNATGGRRALAGAFWDLRTRLLYCTGNETPCTVNENCTGPEVCADGKCLVPCQDESDCSTGEKCISGHCRVSCSTTACSGGAACTDRATEQLFTDFLLLSGIRRSFVEPAILTELLTADDDDGDLSNGTPNCSEIICAFVGEPGEGQDPCQPHPGDSDVCPLPEDCQATPKMGHGFACPTLVGVDDGSVVVTWLGPVGVDPEAGVDYEVNYQTIPPSVILKTTQVGIVPVDRYRVGRMVNDLPSVLGAIVSDWDGPANDITVEIGTTAQGQCRELHSATILPQGSGKWTSMGVETVDAFFGDIVGRLEVHSVDGVGGRISGNVAGRLKSANAYAIGIDAGGSEPTGEGNLTVASAPTRVI